MKLNIDNILSSLKVKDTALVNEEYLISDMTAMYEYFRDLDETELSGYPELNSYFSSNPSFEVMAFTKSYFKDTYSLDIKLSRESGMITLSSI